MPELLEVFIYLGLAAGVLATYRAIARRLGRGRRT